MNSMRFLTPPFASVRPSNALEGMAEFDRRSVWPQSVQTGKPM